MPRFSLQAESATAGYTVTRTVTEDGRDAVFKNLMQAQQQAYAWVALLNEQKFSDATDWTAQVVKS